MRSTFWPNKICERQSCQNRHTGLKFSPKRQNSALFMKIVQNPFFGSCAAQFGQTAFFTVKVLKIVKLASKSLQNGKTVRFPWKLDKTLFSGRAQHVLAKSHFWAFGRKFSPKRENSQTLGLGHAQEVHFSKSLHTVALFMKISGHQHVLAKSHFWASKLSKSSHWPEILFKTGKQCAFHENCTERFFQVMRSTFWPNRICERQSSQNRHTGRKFSVQNGKTVRFSWKLYKTLFSGHAQHVLAKSHFWASKFSKSSHWPEILAKTGKGCAFHENCTKRSFQVMRSTFWRNQIGERQTSQNRYTCPKFFSKRENSALFMKIVQNALFRSCAARFGQIAFLSVKVLKIVTLAWNSLQNGKTVRFPWKLYKTLVSGHAQHVLAKSNLWASKLSKSSHWPQSLSKKGKQCAFHENCTKRSFQVMRSTFWPNRIFERQSSQNRHTGLKVSSKRENSALFMKIVQNALFRSCAARFGQIVFLRVKLLKIVTLGLKFSSKKTVRFSWKLYKRLFSGHAQHVLAKSHFWASKLSIRHTGLKFSSKRPNSALSMKIVPNARFRSYAARFGQIAFVSVKVVKIATLAVYSLQKGKTVRFPWKLYKTLFSGHAQHVFAKSNLWGSKFLK